MKKLIFALLVLLSFQKLSAQLPDGSIAPDFNLQDVNGNYHHLYDILDSGKYVIIDFFGVMCGPCWTYYTSGSMEKAYLKYGPQGTDHLRAFTLECQESTTNQIKGTQQPTKGDWTNLVSFPVLHTHAPNSRAVVDAYHPVGIPFFFIICPDKRVRQMHNPDSLEIHNAMNTCPVGAHDSLYLTFAKIDSLKPFSCNNFISPVVQIQNYGIDTIHSFRTKTYFNNVLIDSIVWNQTLKPYGVNLLNFNYSGMANGSYKLKIITDRINGKTNIVPDSIFDRFTVATTSQILPLTESFANSGFPYNNWTITKEKLIFPDWDWIDLGYAQSVYLPLYNIPFGYSNEIIFPRFDFSSTVSPVLSFDYAYAKNPRKDVDEISVSYKESCDAIWHVIRFMSNDSIRTASDNESFFVPALEEWKTFNVSLAAVPKNPDIFIKVRGVSHEGGNFYLDNLVIKDNASGIDDGSISGEKLAIYPNPVSDVLNISLSSERSELAEISIINLLGKMLKFQKVNLAEGVVNNIAISVNDLS